MFGSISKKSDVTPTTVTMGCVLLKFHSSTRRDCSYILSHWRRPLEPERGVYNIPRATAGAEPPPHGQDPLQAHGQQETRATGYKTLANQMDTES